MSWYKVAQSTTMEGLQSAVPARYQEIPAGKRTLIVLDTSPFPIAPIFDLAGAEFAARLLEHNGRLIDVRGSGAFKVEMEIESVDSGASMSGDAQMHLAPVIMWIGVIAGVLVLLPLVLKLATLFANFVPSSDGNGSSSSFFDYLKTLFGDYTPFVVAGGVILLVYLLSSRRGGAGAPVIYNLPSGSRRREDD